MTAIVLEANGLVLSVKPEVGGRVAELLFRGRPLLSGPEVNEANWGSTYWTSPQADWGWPPIAAIDSEPFEVIGGEPLRLRGPRARLGATEVRLEKSFRALPGRAAFEIEYSLENVGGAPVRVAGWEISRVPAGGLTFYPTGEAELTPIAPHSALHPTKEQGYSFYDHSSFESGRSLKVHADGERGLLAHVTAGDANGTRLLFLKRFEDTKPSEQAPGEGEVEIFANEDGRYVEIEVQGAWLEIPPGERRQFKVEWEVHEVPSALDVKVGSRELLDWLESLLSASPR